MYNIRCKQFIGEMKMDGGVIYKKSLDCLSIMFLAGSKSKCLPGWGFYDIISPYNKLYYIVEGRMEIRINGEDLIATPGDCLLLPVNTKQSFKNPDKDQPLLKYWVHFTAGSDDSNLLEKLQLPYMIHVKDQERMQENLQNIVNLWQNEDPALLYTQKALLLEVLASYLEDSGRKLCFKNYDQRIERVIQYIERNISKDFTGPELAEQAGLNPIYFIRFFKQQTGENPLDFITKTRIYKAKELLYNSCLSFEEISNMVGVPNYKYFARTFKRITGFTPSQYHSMMTEADYKTYPSEMVNKKIIYKV